jgi:hypothetical protein
MTLNVEELLSCDAEIISFLNALSCKTPSVLGYHYPFFREMLAGIELGEPIYLGARQNGKLVGMLPAFSIKSQAGTIYSSLPFFGPNAGVLCNADESQAEIHQALLKALLRHAEQANALSCSIYTPFLFKGFSLYDSLMPEAIVVNRFTQYLALTTTSWRQGALARNLRKAEREGVEIDKRVTPQRLEIFYTIYRQNCIEYDIPQKPRKCVEFLTQSSFIGRYTDIYFAFYRGEMIGGLLVVYSPQTVSYYIPCSITKARTLQPGALLINQALKEAQARDVKYWNWESSPSREDGVYRFKEKWGSSESLYRIYVQAFCSPETFQQLGQDTITSQFPFYFVYPFDRIYRKAG